MIITSYIDACYGHFLGTSNKLVHIIMHHPIQVVCIYIKYVAIWLLPSYGASERMLPQSARKLLKQTFSLVVNKPYGYSVASH